MHTQTGMTESRRFKALLDLRFKIQGSQDSRSSVLNPVRGPQNALKRFDALLSWSQYSRTRRLGILNLES